MKNYHKLLLSIVLIIRLLCYLPANAEITIEPFGFALAIDEDEEAEIGMSLFNTGEEDVAFEINYELVEDDENRLPGPRRDDLGDRIDEYRVGNGTWTCLAWDGDLIWGVNYDNDNMIAINMDGDVVHEVQCESHPVGMCWDGEAFWVARYSNNNLDRIDNEGDIIGTVEVEARVAGLAWDGENLWTSQYREDGVFQQVNLEGEVLRTLDCNNLDINFSNWCGLTWVPEHNDGYLWIANYQDETIYQLNIDEEDPEIVQQVDTGENVYELAHDGENMWYSFNGDTWYVIDDGVEEFHMLTFEPEEGRIAGDDTEQIGILIETVECKEGLFNILIQIELDDQAQPLIELSAVITVGDQTCDISGVVTSAATEQPVEGVTISMDRYLITRYTNDDGEYRFYDLPPAEYEFTFTATDFLPSTENIGIDDDDVELDVALLHSECTPSEGDFIATLGPGESSSIRFDVYNGGTGPLSYVVERRLVGDADLDPWELRLEVNLEEVVDDNQINGVVYADDRFFVSGGNNRDDDNKIYVFNSDGEFESEFDQFHESDYGMRNLCWDGELIWGADDDILYGFNTEGELISEIEGDVPSYRALTYDTDNNLFISSNITSDIFLSDRDGEIIRTIERQGNSRMYGLAYWSDDPDGYNLYVFSRGDETDLKVNKINIENSDLAVVTEIDMGNGRPGGICITNQFDIYSWVFIGIVQNPDRLAIWQLATNREWFRIEPEAGEIEAEGREDFVLTLDATGLLPDNTFEGILVFHHNGIGGRTEIAVRLEVTGEEIHTTRTLDLLRDWNTVSVNLQPDEEDVEVLMSDLVEQDILVMMKDGAGHFYRPDYDFNNIPGWSVEQGYQIKMRDEAQLTLEGWSVAADEPIRLEEGWQLISYYPRSPIEATLALSGIEDHLIICKDGFGNFYIPAWDYCNMGNMCEGQGYQINVDADVELVYMSEREDAMRSCSHAPAWEQESVYTEPGLLPIHTPTGVNMSLLVLTDPSLTGNIGVYASGKLVGSGVLQDGYCGIAVWGDDPVTDEIDGALEDQDLEIQLIESGGRQPVVFEILSGTPVYQTDSFCVVKLSSVTEPPSEFEIVSIYPNPFNSTTRITYSLPMPAKVELKLFDLNGREVVVLINESKQSGIHTANLNAVELPSGLYLLRLNASEQTLTRKIMLIK